MNFFRYGVYALVDGIIEGQFVDETLYALVVQDIFHFAGIAFIITGAFKALKLKEWHIFVIGIILSMVGAPLAFLYNGHPVLNYIIGHFIITTKEDSTFAFFNWYIFVSFGLLFGSLLKNTSNKDKLYFIVLIVSLPLMVIYIILSILFGPMFLSKNCWYYATSLPESIGLLSIDMVLLSSFYFLIKKVPIQRLKVFEVMSRNITPIYITQWCIIGFVDSIFCYLLGFIFPYWVEYLFGVVLIFISYWIAKGSRILQRKIFNKQIKSEIK